MSSDHMSQQKILSLSQKIDQLLQFYVKYTSSAGNQDKILKVVQYSLFMLARFYPKRVRAAMEKLSDEVCWTRYVNRFFGLPTSIEGVRSGSWASSKALGKAMAWTMIGYYPLEHVAYLKWRAPDICLPSRSDSRLAARASAWSCRFWLAYIILDTLRVFPSKDISELSSEEENSIARQERLQLVRNALFVLPAVSWSLPKWDTDPLFSPPVCNWLMWLESIVCMYQGVSS